MEIALKNTGLPANLEIMEIRKKSGDRILSQQVKEKSGNFQFLTKSKGKGGKVRGKLFVAMITFNNVFHCIFQFLLPLDINYK